MPESVEWSVEPVEGWGVFIMIGATARQSVNVVMEQEVMKAI